MIRHGIDIIRAGAASLEILQALHGACFAAGWDAMAFARLLAMPGSTGTIAAKRAPLQEDATPAGFLLGSEAGGEAEIISTGVLPEMRGRGIGGALVAEFTSRMQQRGANAVFLEVAVDNAAALSLYKRLGFVTVGLRKAYYAPEAGVPDGRAIDALVMRRNL
ncbi:MAG: GNAT family N-acetyltransferase [Alphaproteobacteria bacterium]